MHTLFAIIGYIATAAAFILLLKRYFRKKRIADDPLVDIRYPEEHGEIVTQPDKDPSLTHNLSPVQETKLTFLFNLLDFNRNGFIQQDDFTSIAENMSIIKAETLKDHHIASVRKFMEKSWIHLSHVESDHYKIPLNEWLHFADKEIVNCSQEKYNNNIEKLVHAIFLFFDDNKDKHLNLVEYMSLLVSFRADFRNAKMSFESLDTNKDGLISEDELSHAVWAFFHSSDADERGNWLFGEWKVHEAETMEQAASIHQ